MLCNMSVNNIRRDSLKKVARSTSKYLTRKLIKVMGQNGAQLRQGWYKGSDACEQNRDKT